MDRENTDYVVVSRDRLTKTIRAGAGTHGAMFASHYPHFDERLSRPMPKSQVGSRPVQMVYPAIQRTHREDPYFEAVAGYEMGKDASGNHSDSSCADESNIQSDGSDPSFSNRRERNFVPDDLKNANYWVKRQKNNMAAKRSREKRRIADGMLESKVSKLAQENEDLKSELASIKQLVTERLVPGRQQEGMIRPTRSISDQSDMYLQVRPAKRARYLANSAPCYAPPPTHAHQIPPQYKAPLSRLPELAPQMPTAARPPHPIPAGYMPGGAGASVVPFYPHTHETHIPMQQQPWVAQVNSQIPQMVHQVPTQMVAVNPPALRAPRIIAADNLQKACVPFKADLLNSAVIDLSHKSKNSNIEAETVSTVSPSAAAGKDTSHSSTPKDSEREITTTSPAPPTSPAPSDTSSSSPSLNDQQPMLSPSEISKLPHKLRARMMRALSGYQVVQPEPNVTENSEDKANKQEVATSVIDSVESPPNKSIPPLVKIKEEIVDDEADVISKGCGQWAASSAEPAPKLRRLPPRPKEEFPAAHPRSIEEEIEQARGLISNPMRPPRMSAEETEAYAELLKTSTDLVAARIQVADFHNTTLRHLTRQRTRDMNEHDKYRDKRVRNNIAAKKCRDAKRLLMDYRAARSTYLELENINLQHEMQTLSTEVRQLREMLNSRVVSH